MSIPSELRYTEDHEWIRDEGDCTATVGVTDFAQGELGDIVFVELEPEGAELNEGEVFGTVEAVKTVSELFMPVAGTVTAVNDALETNPEQVNDDPYGDGWMIRIELADPDALGALMTADAYGELV